MDTQPNPALRWPPFVLQPSAAPHNGRPMPKLYQMGLRPGVQREHATFADFDLVARMSVDDVLKHCAVKAVDWHVKRDAGRPGLAKDVRQWLESTRALSDEVPFTHAAKAAMRAAAGHVEADLTWPHRYCRAPAQMLSQAGSEWWVSLNLWVADRLLRATNDVEAAAAADRGEHDAHDVVYYPPTEFWPAMFAWLPEDRYPAPPFTDYVVAHTRVARFARTIHPDAHDELMVEMLHSAFHGPYGPHARQEPAG